MYDELVKRLRESKNEKCYIGCFGNCVSCKIDAELEQAADAIEHLADTNVGKWIPVTERLPNNGKNVLVFEFGRVEQAYTTTYTADGSLCWVVINGGSYHRISDADCPIKWWMPLPQPPKEE